MNLLINAQQALQSEAPPRSIAISSTLDGEVIAVRVKDNGPGITRDIAKRIFDPFFTTKPEGTGTGIGLAYSLGVVEGHDGALELEDGSNGASFLIRLPVGQQTDAPKAEQAPPASKPEFLGRAIVVDDEPDLASAIARMLQRLGFETVTAGNGREACEIIGDQDFSLILSDLRMPGMDGSALHAWISERRPDLVSRIAFLTGDTLSPSAVNFLKLANRPYMAKPITLADLAKLVEELTSNLVRQ